MMVEKAAVGRGRRREKEGEEAGKARVADQTADMMERASMPLSICLPDPQGQGEAVT
jgi:hypothetical protein